MFENFYKFIKKTPNGHYLIEKNDESYGSFKDLPTALYERDRLKAVNWDWDKYVNLPDGYNNYIHVDLPPFKKEPSYISVERECWVVRDKKTQKHRGRYWTLDEAKKVALIYDANVSHKNKGYCVRRWINGRSVFFGRYKTWDEAKKRVEELKQNNWRK